MNSGQVPKPRAATVSRVAGPSCRPTNRCSGPGHIKCLAAGVDASSVSQLFRARVLTSQRATAELSR
jgi:hypothetical protein